MLRILTFALLFVVVSVIGGRAVVALPQMKANATLEPFEFQPGVIVAPARGTAYIMNPGGGINAVELASGHLLWQSSHAEKPLLVNGALLLAQRKPRRGDSKLRLVGLRLHDGRSAGFEVNVELPKGSRALISDELGKQFRIKAHILESKTVISWWYREIRIGGVAPGAGVKPVHQSKGTVQINLSTGRSVSIANQMLPPFHQPALPANLARLVTSGALRGPPRKSGGVWALAERTSGNGGEHVVLRRWNRADGKALPDLVLFKAGPTFRYVSADGRHLLASDPASADGPGWLWVIHSTETGERVATLRRQSPAAWFFVWHSRLLYGVQPTGRRVNRKWVIRPPQFRAIDITSGNEAWSHPVRDTAYRGLFPARRGAAPPAPAVAPQ